MKTPPTPGQRIYRGYRYLRVVALAPVGTMTNGSHITSPVWICQETTPTGRDLLCRPTRIQEHTLIRAWREVADVG